jgi:hypothetical protein
MLDLIGKVCKEVCSRSQLSVHLHKAFPNHPAEVSCWCRQLSHGYDQEIANAGVQRSAFITGDSTSNRAPNRATNRKQRRLPSLTTSPRRSSDTFAKHSRRMSKRCALQPHISVFSQGFPSLFKPRRLYVHLFLSQSQMRFPTLFCFLAEMDGHSKQT